MFRFRLFIMLLFVVATVVSSASGVRYGDYESNDSGRTWIYSPQNSKGKSGDGSKGLKLNSNYTLVKELIITGAPVAFGDADHNGKIECYSPLFTSSYSAIRVYEFDSNLDTTIKDLPFYGIPWAFGDIDHDGLADLVIQTGDPGWPSEGNGYLRIYESPDPYSYPSILKQQITLPGRKVEYRALIIDTDKDGKNEVLLSANGFGIGDLRIYEWENDSLVLKWTAPEIQYITLTKAVADFDGDSKIEIATVESRSKTVYVYETIGDNQYTFIQSWLLPSHVYCGYDAVPATNPDGGSSEFAVGLNYLSEDSSQFEWIIYREVNDNFTQWWSTTFPKNIWITMPRHTTGDYDQDGYDEILVADYPTVKILEYLDGGMGVTWTQEQSSPTYLTSADLRLDGLMNFIVGNSGRIGIWEDSRLLAAGHLTEDTIWDRDVLVLGDVTVDSGVTLTIQPGAEVRFTAGADNLGSGVDSTLCELIVEGSLDAQGTAAQPISISSTYEGAWWGIRFKQGSSGLLKHAVVEYGYCGVLADSGSTVTIDSCTIQNNEVYGVRCDHTGGATTISGNRIWNNGVYGVWTEHCSPDILDNQINGSRYGIKASYAGSDMLIRGNSIDNASIQPKDQPPYDNYVGISLQNSSPLILDNEIGGGKGLSGLSCSSGSNPEVRSCIIDARCKKGISCYDGSSPTVDSTQVHSYTERGIYCYQSSYPRLGDTGIEGSGGNSISSPDGGYEVWCEENLQPVMAESCWWGMAIPDPSRFHGAVDWLPCLDHDPFGEVGVEDGPKEGLPARFALSQNYPNPFNPTTLIRYSLPVARQGRSGEGGSRARTTSTSYVSLKVYNILGQEVRALVDEPQAPGYYQVRWDGRDNLGKQVSSGIYFYRLRVMGDRLKMVKTRKMVLIR